MGDLSSDFSRAEFACTCGCGADQIDLALVAILQGMRETIGRPLKIVSGVRCPKRNAAVGGKRASAHLEGLAVDIACADSALRYELVGLALRAGIRRIGVAKNFVHLDIGERNGRPGEVMWMY